MLIIAHHNIRDPKKFWDTAKNQMDNMPPSLHLHSVFPSKDHKLGTCLWEADSVEAVQKHLDKNVGAYAQNNCYELSEQEAIGIPEVAHHH